MIAQINKLRTRIAELKTAIADLLAGSVPISKEEAYRRGDAYIAGLVAHAEEQLKIDALVVDDAGDPPTLIPTLRIAPGQQLVGLERVEAMFAWFDEGQFRKRLRKTIDDRYADLGGVPESEADQAKRLDEHRRELKQLERQEFDLTAKAINAGLPIQHRDDVPPSLILGIET